MALVKEVDAPREPHARRRLEVFNPATLARIGEVEVDSEDDVRAAIERSRKAFDDWSHLSFRERASYMLKVRDTLIDRADEVAETIMQDTGKPCTEALMMEVVAACDPITFFAKNAEKWLKDEKKPLHGVFKIKKLVLSYRPMGVVGIITPWNFPFLLSINPAVQALMAGNTVVLKPSEVTPFVGLKLAELFAAAGIPEDVFQVVTGDGGTGAALVGGGCDKISFTGSVATGRKIAEACGRQLIPCTLELGGNDPMIVCADADLERAANGAVWGAFCNSGQVCISTERVYVVEEVAKPFIERVVELTNELRQGPEIDGDSDLGSLTFPPQLDIIERHVKDAVDKGAKVLTGGRRNPAYEGYFWEPTVLTNVTHEMQIMQEETFGPTLPIMVVRDEAEALRLANDSRYGLSSSVWTRDKTKGKQLANQIRAGASVVNDCLTTYGVMESPFGGVNESGVGRVNGETGLKSYCHVQSVLTARIGGKREYNWYPYTAKKRRTLRRAMGLLYRSPIGKLLGN